MEHKGTLQDYEYVKVPSILRDIRRPPMEGESYVSEKLTVDADKPERERMLKEPCVLNSGNHALYVGKFRRFGPMNSVKSFVGAEAMKSIYSDEMMAASLDWAKAHLAPGAIVTVAVGRSVSELINGGDDVKSALTFEQQKKRILGIARRCGLKENRIEVVLIDDMPGHKELFDALRESVDPQKQVADPVKVFGSGDADLPENPTSLQVARVLFKAAEASEVMRHALLNTVPGYLEKKSKDKPDEEGMKRLMCYGLAEIAIRTVDIINGRNIHAGAKRQYLYDKVIGELVLGRKGSYKKIRELNPLFDLLEHKLFRAVHIDTDDNPRIRKRDKIRAWTKLAAMAVVSASMMGGGWVMRYAEEKREQSLMEELVADKASLKLEDLRFYWEAGGKWPIDKSDNLKVFNSMADAIMREMEARYDVGHGDAEEVRPLLQEYLLTKSSYLQSAHNNWQGGGLDHDLFILLEDFLSKRELFLRSKGFPIDKPFPALMGHIEEIKAAAEGGAITIVEQESADYGIHSARAARRESPDGCSAGPSSEGICRLGEFRGINGINHILYLHRDEEGRKHILADYYRNDKAAIVFPADKAEYAAKELLKVLEVRDMAHLFDYDREFWNLSVVNGVEYLKSAPADVDNDDEYRFEKIGFYADSLGRFSYELALYHYYDDKKEVTGKFLVARDKGSGGPFTFEKGKEAARHYCRARYAWSKESYEGSDCGGAR